MTQSMDYTATVKTKRCKNTGMTEEIIRRLHGQPGARVMAVIELCVDDAHNKHDAPNHVDFTIEQLVPFPDDRGDQHLRQLTKSAHQERILHSDDEQLAIDTQDDLEPSVEDVIEAQRAHQANQPHVFDPAEDGDDCVVCREDFDHQLHVTVPEPAVEPDEEPADDPAADQEPVPVA